ncbi:MAG: phosphatase PAP2 family protein [Bacteroidota bacterium]
MIEAILEADQQIFLWLNSFHANWLDPIMYRITNKYTWFPVYAALVVAIILKYRWEGVRIVLVLVLVITACDQLTSGFMKPTFERLRPCHNPTIAHFVHLVKGCGGQYGFASSHAANTFGLAATLWFFFQSWSFWFALGFGWAAVVSYSRVYVGVHYPLDIIVGAIIGVVLAWMIYKLYQQYRVRLVAALPYRYQ